MDLQWKACWLAIPVAMQVSRWKLQHKRVNKEGGVVLLMHVHEFVPIMSDIRGLRFLCLANLCKRVFVNFAAAQEKHRRCFSPLACASTLQPRASAGP